MLTLLIKQDKLVFMQFKKIENSQLNVSTICLGTMTMGSQNKELDAFKLMDFAADRNINFFDTAEQYASPSSKKTFGTTEKIIGKWFKQKMNRDKIILATKISGPGNKWIRGGGFQYNKENLKIALEGSLKRLETDYIDIYQLHWPEKISHLFTKSGYEYSELAKKRDNFEEVLNILNEFINQGKIRYIGLCNETVSGFEKYLNLSISKNLPRMITMQNRYNLLDRTIEESFFNINNDKNFGLLTYSPLAFGTLSGKYINNKKPENSRLKLYGNYFPRYSGNFSNLAIKEYYNIAKKFNISLSKLSIAFVLNRSFVTSCIIGSTNIQQLEENIDSVNIKLDNEILEKINFVHKNNPNPSTQIEIKPIYKRIFIYQKEGLKLILNNDWKTLLYKISKIIIKPLKKMLKR